MAHNLEIRDGQASFVKVGQRAWHGLGTLVEEAMTAEQAIKIARLDYTVEKKPVYVQGPLREIPDYFATVRKDTKDILGIVSEKYEIVQNIETFNFFDSIVERGEAMYQTAGVLGKGERMFITAKLPDDIEIGGEKIEKNILLTTGHDGKSPTQIGLTNIAVVCENTLHAALKGLQNKISLLHFMNIHDKIKLAAKIMGLASKYNKLVEESYRKMVEVKITDQKLREYLEAVMAPGQKETLNAEEVKEYSKQFVAKVDSIMQFAKEHPTQQGPERRNTVWGAYNAVSGYYGYLKSYKSASDKMNDMYFKTGANTMLKSYELAAALV
jgi:phage/plasmid-like protein (TIGR03299 family)